MVKRRLIPQDFKVVTNDGGYRYFEADLGGGRTVCVEPNGNNLDVACYRYGNLALPRVSFSWIHDETLTKESRAFSSFKRCLKFLNGEK